MRREIEVLDRATDLLKAAKECVIVPDGYVLRGPFTVRFDTDYPRRSVLQMRVVKKRKLYDYNPVAIYKHIQLDPLEVLKIGDNLSYVLDTLVQEAVLDLQETENI